MLTLAIADKETEPHSVADFEYVGDADDECVTGFVVGFAVVEGDGDTLRLGAPDTDAEEHTLTVPDSVDTGDSDRPPDLLALDDADTCGEGVIVGDCDADGDPEGDCRGESLGDIDVETDVESDCRADVVGDSTDVSVLETLTHDVTEGDGEKIADVENAGDADTDVVDSGETVRDTVPDALSDALLD